MNHRTTSRFWSCYDALPPDIRRLADKNFSLLEQNPAHPSLHFKKVGRYWSARVGIDHRAAAISNGDAEASNLPPCGGDARQGRGGYGLATFAAFALLLLALPAAAADWPVKEQVKTYPVSGTDALALYRSIEVNGPKTSVGTRAIALTRFDLRWRRDYRPDGSACVLAAATPLLTITTELPKPAAKLPPALAARWQPFIAGITAHEAVHGQMIRALAADIVSQTVGTREENDPGCTKIRATILDKVKAAYATHQEKSRAFDKAEMGKGGNVEGLVRALVE